MRVRGGDDVDEVEPLGLDHELGHAHVRLVGVRVLARQRVREIRVEQQVPALPGDQEAALAEPPQVEAIGIGGADVGEQRVAGLERPDHRYRTPVSCSETSHSRRAAAASWAALDADTTLGCPRPSKSPFGPT